MVMKTLKARPIMERMKKSRRAPGDCADGSRKNDMKDDGPCLAPAPSTEFFKVFAGTGSINSSPPAATVSPTAAINATR